MEIKPYEKNAKKHPQKQIKALAKIVKRVGWRQPILVNQQGTIIVGHGRYETWEQNKQSLKEVWVMDDKGVTVMGEPEKEPMSEVDEIAYRLADNKLAESDWDMGLVTDDMRFIEKLEEGLSTITGFEMKDDDFDGEPEIEFTEEILESNNYVVFIFDNDIDFNAVEGQLGLTTKDSTDSKEGYRRRGIGRVLKGQDLLNLFE